MKCGTKILSKDEWTEAVEEQKQDDYQRLKKAYITFRTEQDLKNAMMERFDEFKLSRVLEPYEIAFDSYEKPSTKTTRFICTPLLWVLCNVSIRLVQLIFVQSAHIFAANNSYSIQCNDIQKSFESYNTSYFSEYALIDQPYVNITQQIGIYQCYCQAKNDPEICRQYNWPATKITIAQLIIPSLLAAMYITLVMIILRKGVHFKSKVFQNTFFLAFVISNASSISFTPIFGSPYLPSKFLKAIEYCFWGWGDKNQDAQNMLFFTPLWYQNNFNIVRSALFITPFIKPAVDLFKYLICGGCCYESKTRCGCGICSRFVKDIPKKQPINIFEKTVYFFGTLFFLFAISFGRVDFFLFGLISFIV